MTRRPSFIVAAIAVLLAAFAVCLSAGRKERIFAADSPSRAINPDAAKSSTADETAIRDTADGFTKAFNAGDAKAIGAEWTTDAEYTDETGKVYSGAKPSRTHTPNSSKSIPVRSFA